MANPIVTFKIKDGGVMKAELYPEIAPNNDRPYEDQIIEEITVDTFGVNYGEPEKL